MTSTTSAQITRPGSLPHLWVLGVFHPAQAYAKLPSLQSPAWGFWIIVIFNLLISLTTDLVRWLADMPLVLPSWLTFLPAEDYLLAELFFLPVVRTMVWLLDGAIVYLAMRLGRRVVDMDLLLNMGGLGYLVVMPLIFASDWFLLAIQRYDLATYTHSLALPYSIFLSTVGLRTLFKLSTLHALGLALITLLTLPILSIVAR